MSAKTKQSRCLIDLLAPSAEYEEPRSLLATSYEFDPDFTEQDFLPAVLGIPAWEERSFRTRIVLEQALAKLDAAVFMVEGPQSGGPPRSLRIDFTPQHAPQRVLHAKVVVIVGKASVRLIVGSANLTTTGYRQNREVALTLFASKEHNEQGPLLRQALARIDTVLATWWSRGAAEVIENARQILDGIDTPRSSSDEVFLWGGEETPLWEQFVALWPRREKIDRIRILSPFWSDDAQGGPITKLVVALRERKALSPRPQVELLTGATPNQIGTWLPQLPPSYGSFDFRTLDIDVSAVPVSPRVDTEDVAGAQVLLDRKLHAKILWLEGSETSLVYLGSANFTNKGWGWAPPSNIEAGVAMRRSGKERKAFGLLLPKRAGDPKALIGGKVELSPPEPDPAGRPWPMFIERAELRPRESPTDRDALDLVLTVRLDSPSFVIFFSEAGPARATAPAQTKRGALTFALSGEELGLLLRERRIHVQWESVEGRVAFPINAAPEIRHELLLGGPGSTPGEGELLDFYQGRIALADLVPPDERGPDDVSGASPIADSSQVDTSAILSYRIRSFVEALPGIAQEIARNTTNVASMKWALLGPVSPLALAREIKKAALGGRSATAVGFQLVELLAVLERSRELEVDAALEAPWGETLAKAESAIRAILEEVATQNPAFGTERFGRYRTLALRNETVRSA